MTPLLLILTSRVSGPTVSVKWVISIGIYFLSCHSGPDFHHHILDLLQLLSTKKCLTHNAQNSCKIHIASPSVHTYAMGLQKVCGKLKEKFVLVEKKF